MRAGFVQFEPVFGEKEKNTEKSVRMIRKADADLLVLPEMCNTGYMVKNRKELMELAEEVPSGETTQRWLDVAKETDTVIVAGMPERDGSKVFSTAVIVGPKGFIGRHRKTHLFMKETLFFDKGDTGFRVMDIGKARIGVAVCFDYMFPEVWRKLSLKGADIFCLPVNLVLPYCLEIMKTRSIENSVFSIVCNRTGTERGQTFTGRSEIVDPRMNILAKASVNREEIAVVDIDVKKARNKKVTPYNDLIKDRRPKFY